MTTAHRVYAAIIRKDELRQKINQVIVINILNPDFYYLGSIQGSVKIPLEELAERLHELDKTKEIITYCAHDECISSSRAADLLVELGFQARTYEGGIKEWKTSGLPMED